MQKYLIPILFLFSSWINAEESAEFVYTPYEEQKVVFEFFFDHPAKINAALYWVRSLVMTLSEEPYGYAPDFLEIKVVIHGTEIASLAKKNYAQYNEAVERMRYYAELGVEFRVCSLSAQQFGYEAQDLQEFVQLIPSAVTELVHWQAKGHSIIVPKILEKQYTVEELR